MRPLDGGGYALTVRRGREPLPFLRKTTTLTARNVVFAGGVLGTVELLLRLKESPDGLPKISDRLGDFVRTNSEVLMGVVSDKDEDLSKGIAIGSILETDEHSHLEPVRYPAGSGFFRLLAMPHAPGDTVVQRLAERARSPLPRARQDAEGLAHAGLGEAHDDPPLHAHAWTARCA